VNVTRSVAELLLTTWDDTIDLVSLHAAGGGLYNTVCFLETSIGKVVLRIAPPDDVPKLFYEELMMRAEPGIHELVRSRTGIPAPRILFHDFSRSVIDADYLIMEHVSGHSGGFSEAELGAYVRQLHAIHGDDFGYPQRDMPTFPTWRETMLAYVHHIFEDCTAAGALERSTADWFVNKYRQYEDVFAAPSPHLLHLDLWRANILAEEGRISGILDFDRGMFGDPELEFAVLDTYGLATCEFFKGYGSPRPSDTNARLRQKLYVVYELIKYAFIRLARGGSRSTAEHYVSQCRQILLPL